MAIRFGFKSIVIAGAAFAARPALAQLPAGYSVVPPAERLTFAGVFADADIVVQTMMTLMIGGAIAALVIWGLSLAKVGKGDAKAVAGALGWLKIIRCAGGPLGVLTAGYTLLGGFIALSNVRPAPTISIMAPGWAEAALALVLGMLATTVGVICERSLEARVRRAAA
jgi:hypothetical protein